MNKDKQCIIDGCFEPVRAKDHCRLHYQRLYLGRLDQEYRIKSYNGEWSPWKVNNKGYVGRFRSLNGVRSHQLEHRYVMEQTLGRDLLPGENVHHKNGDRSDNRPDNLELWITRQPQGQRVEDMLVWADEIIKRYRKVE